MVVSLSSEGEPCIKSEAFVRAGPREHIVFDPSDIRIGIVTCGGLCPGMVSDSSFKQIYDGVQAKALYVSHGYNVVTLLMDHTCAKVKKHGNKDIYMM